MDIPSTFLINSKQQRFTVKTLNGIQKASLQELIFKYIFAEDIHNTQVILAEVIASNFYTLLWDCLFELWVNYIHMGHVKMFIWLCEQKTRFEHIKTNNGPVHKLKNNQEIRNMFSQIASIMCLVPKFKVNKFIIKPSNRVSSESIKLATQYYNNSFENTHYLFLLTRFIECYRKSAKCSAKNSYGLITQIYQETHSLDTVWKILMDFGKKEDIPMNLIKMLKQKSIYFLNKKIETSITYAYIATCIVKNYQQIADKKIPLTHRYVIKNNMIINYIYSNLETHIKYIKQPDLLKKEQEEEEMMEIMVNAVPKKKRIPSPKKQEIHEYYYVPEKCDKLDEP